MDIYDREAVRQVWQRVGLCPEPDRPTRPGGSDRPVCTRPKWPGDLPLLLILLLLLGKR